jgi:hypothetical protein
MNHNLTDITFVLDRSGSMSNVWHKAVSGLKDFVTTQRGAPGDAFFSLIAFDGGNPQLIVCRNYLRHINEDTCLHDVYPRGTTPLYDAVGCAIDHAGVRLANQPERDRPANVVFVVYTDGEENTSRKYSSAKVKKLVRHQRDRYGWQFIFLGADIDAYRAGARMGFSEETTANVDKERKTDASFRHVSGNLANYRTTGDAADLGFSANQLSDMSSSYAAQAGVQAQAKPSQSTPKSRHQAPNVPQQIYGEGKTWIKLECPHCKDRFWQERRQTHWAKGRQRTYCSRSCSSSHYRNGDTPQVALAQIKSHTKPASV